MSLSIKDSKWLKPVLIIVLALVVLLMWAQLAGGIFLVTFGRNFDDATPLTFLQYWYYQGAQIKNRLFISSALSFIILFAPVILILFRTKKKSLFGDARFANRHDVRKAGLFGDKGLIVGKLGNRYLMFGGSQHAIISAPTRSGKGVGIVIPNLLNWPESSVVLDVKQENWDITSGYRAKYGQECYLFNPAATDCRTHRYNPLSYISDNLHFRIDDIQKIGNMLFPDRPGTDPIWTATPRSLFTGIVLYLLETPEKPVTLGQVLRETLHEDDGADRFLKIINDRKASANPLSGDCVRNLNSYISIASENTRSGIITGFRAQLELWMNPLVDAATSGNDFDLRDVRKRRMSIYVGITPDNLSRMAPLVNLFFQQLIDLNTRELPNRNKELRHTCLLLMDEFTAIGKIPILSKGISYIAGYGLRMMPIIQSPSQLSEVYGRDAAQTFQMNHAMQIIFPPKASETSTAKDISEWLGYQTVKGTSRSQSGGAFKNKTSESISDQRRALMLPQEITSLGQERELVVMENTSPILAEKVVYYKDATFTRRLKEVSPNPDKRGAPVPLIDLDAHMRLVSGKIPLSGTASKDTKGGIAHDAKKILSAFTLDLPPSNDDAETDVDALNAYADELCREAGLL